MAGTTRPVTSCLQRALLLSAVCAATLQGAQTDVLLVAHPERLLIFNKYQQRLTSDESSRLVPFAPMVVVRADDQLGDGLTRCTTVRVGNDLFYLQTSHDGTLQEPGGPAGVALHRDVRLLGDTIVVRKDRSLFFALPDRRGKTEMRRGDRMLRYFLKDGEAYVRKLGHAAEYGWLDLRKGENDSWALIHESSATDARTSGEILATLSATVAEANATLRQLYRHLGADGRESATPPQFRLEVSGDTVLCAFDDPRKATRHSGMLGALAHEFERILSGTGATFRVRDTAIAVTYR